MPDELRALMVRYCSLGNLLPASDDIDTSDVAAVTEARLACRRKR